MITIKVDAKNKDFFIGLDPVGRLDMLKLPGSFALGAVDEYDAREVPFSKRPAIVGIDGTKEGLDAVGNGSLLGTVYNDKEGQARAMFRLSMILANGGSIEDLSGEFDVTDGKYIRLPYAKVTAANINEYLGR